MNQLVNKHQTGIVNTGENVTKRIRKPQGSLPETIINTTGDV